MGKEELVELYFDWVCKLVYDGSCFRKLSYTSLLRYLFNTPFSYTLPMDENRESDGIELRYRFACDEGYDYPVVATYLDNRPCSMLEMMVALALRCEEDIMDDVRAGDRVGQWFWEMIVSLGLGDQNNVNFDPIHVDDVIQRFLNHRYKRNGEGGLFTIPNCEHDMRTAEIWYQMNWYLLYLED